MDAKRITDAIARYVLDEAALILLVLDRAGTLLRANAYACRLIGLNAGGACPQAPDAGASPASGSLAAVLPERFPDILVDFTHGVTLSGMLERPDIPHLLNIRTAGGLPQTFYFRFLDLGPEILAVGEINNLEIETLRKNLILANQELSNLSRELQKTNAELVRSNDLKNQFLGMAAHDLRNPIGVILSYSEFLGEETADVLSEEHLQFLQTIRRSSEFMLRLLNDLLDLARIESGRLDLEREPVDLAALIRENVLLNQVLADKKGIRIAFHAEDDLPPVPVDRQKIEQVLNNLLSNAMKFSPAGTAVFVSLSRTGGDAVVSIRDEGQGIPEADRQKLFQPFARMSVKSTGGEKSTGLGLAIVRKIVEGHAGRIRVESEPGRGTAVSFSLPLTDPPGGAP